MNYRFDKETRLFDLIEKKKKKKGNFAFEEKLEKLVIEFIELFDSTRFLQIGQ